MQYEDLDEALQTLGAVLVSRGTPYTLAVVGGGGLLLLRLLDRPTRDMDVVAIVEDGTYVKPEGLPAPLAAAVADVGNALGLAPDWINVGPSSLLDLGLPTGFRSRADVRRFEALELHVASRTDQICLKLYAAVDQGPRSKHMADLRRLTPGPEELADAARWVVTHDGSPGFRRELLGALRDLGVEEVPGGLG
jgi:hypothetical protein